MNIFGIVILILGVVFSVLMRIGRDQDARGARPVLNFFQSGRMFFQARGIFKHLKRRFGFRCPRGILARDLAARGCADGHQITLQCESADSNYYFRLSLSMEKSLPAFLEVAKSRTAESRGLEPLVTVSLDSLLGILYGGEQEVKGGYAHAIRSTAALASDLYLRGSTLSLSFPAARANPSALENAVRAATALASRLREKTGLEERVFDVLLDRLENARGADRRRDLELLVRFFRNRPQTMEILEQEARGADFASGIFALEKLKRDVFPFLRATLETGSAADRRLAMTYLGSSGSKRVLDLLLELYPVLPHSDTKIDAIGIFKKHAEKRAGALLAGELADRNWRIAQAAAEALAVCGNREAIGPLRALAESAATSGTLRQIVLTAIGAIHRRLGLPEEGLLSFAENPALDGALSMDEQNHEDA